MAPSFPLTVTTEMAFGADPDGDPTGWSWTDVSSDVRYPDQVKITRGRSDERNEAEPAQCSLTLMNPNGDYTPDNATGAHYPDVVLNVPIRVTVTTDGTGYRRFSGFVSAWNPEWPEGDLSPPFALVRVGADGILRRMSQGAQALDSPLFRALSTHDNVVAYWPCEGGRDSEQAASPLDGVNPLNPSGVTFGASSEQGDDSVLFGASSVMRIDDPARNVLGRVPNHTPGAVYVVELAWLMPDEATAARAIMDVYTTSPDLARWQIRASSTTFQLRAWDSDDVEVVNSTETVSSDLWGQWVRAELRLRDQGTNVTAFASLFAIEQVSTVDAGATVLNSVDVSVAGSPDMGRVTRAGVNGPGMFQTRYAGHIAVLTGTNAELPIVADTLGNLSKERNEPFHAFTGELAADRFERLCDEEGLTCAIVAPTGGLRVPGDDSAGSNASTPDAAALDITGDLDVRAWVAPFLWEEETNATIVGKWDQTNDERSWRLSINSLVFAQGTTGITFSWSTDGTSGAASSSVSGELPIVPPDGLAGFAAIRATLDVDNGSSEHVVTFYRGPSLDGPWTEFYSETIAGTTSIHSGTADLVVGRDDDGDTDLDAIVREVRVYDGIGGTLVASPDFTAQTIGATSFDDAQGNTWTLNGDAAIVRADDTMPMGPQQIDTLVANFRALEVADGGIFGEDEFGLFYRTLATLYNQAAALDLDAATDLENPFLPRLDDQAARNDVTAKSPFGTSVRAVGEDHVTDSGRYTDPVEINPETTDQLRQGAYWLLHLGTWPGMRYPAVPLALTSEPTLITSWGTASLGDRAQISNLPVQHPADAVDLLIRGWSETLTEDEWRASINASPASPYDVAVFDTSRLDTAGSETSGSFDAGTDTSLTVVTTATRPWVNSTDHASEFPFNVVISGVELEITGITGSTSPQSFSVTQAPVNGVEKTIPSGSAVRLANTPVFAL